MVIVVLVDWSDSDFSNEVNPCVDNQPELLLRTSSERQRYITSYSIHQPEDVLNSDSVWAAWSDSDL